MCGRAVKNIAKVAAVAAGAYYGLGALGVGGASAGAAGGLSATVGAETGAASALIGGGAATAAAVSGGAAGGLTLGQAALGFAGSQVLGSLLAPKPQQADTTGAQELTAQATKVTPMPSVIGAKERARAEQKLLRRGGGGLSRQDTILSDRLG